MVLGGFVRVKSACEVEEEVKEDRVKGVGVEEPIDQPSIEGPVDQPSIKGPSIKVTEPSSALQVIDLDTEKLTAFLQATSHLTRVFYVRQDDSHSRLQVIHETFNVLERGCDIFPHFGASLVNRMRIHDLLHRIHQSTQILRLEFAPICRVSQIHRPRSLDFHTVRELAKSKRTF